MYDSMGPSSNNYEYFLSSMDSFGNLVSAMEIEDAPPNVDYNPMGSALAYSTAYGTIVAASFN